MARTKQIGGKRVTGKKTIAGKVPRKSLAGKGGKNVVAPEKRKYRRRPGSKLISRKINTFTDWIYSQGPSRN
jgi:hypothetical protein